MDHRCVIAICVLALVVPNYCLEGDCKRYGQASSDKEQPPVIINNKHAEVDMGGRVQITAKLLKACTVIEPSEQLMYVLNPPYNNPSHGELILVVPTPSSGHVQGWEVLPKNKMAARVSRFLQNDIDHGKVWYRHFKGSSAVQDSFQFQISDTQNPPNILENQSFDIRIHQLQGDQAAPTVAPGVRLGMTVYENHLVPITSDDLAYLDIDTEDRDIVYLITQPLRPNQGTVELIERPFEPTRRFTQEDVNRNMVIYRPPTKELGTKDKQFSFHFYVTDRASGRSLPEQKFTIIVKPVNNMPPTLKNAHAKVEVFQNGMTPIGGVLSIKDPDTSVDDIVLTLVDNPRAGNIVKTEGRLRTLLRPGDKFTYPEVMKNVFFYQHDGSELLKDNLNFMVDDGAHNIPVTLPVEVRQVDSRAPTMVGGVTMSVVVNEGEVALVKRQHLAFSDNSGDKHLKYTITSPLVYGNLYRERTQRLTMGNTFTQDDVDNHRIRYMSNGEIGSQEVAENIQFNVSDKAGNTLFDQTLSILLLPIDNQVPVVTMGPDVQVTEGELVSLTPADLSVMDVDTPLRSLVFIVEELPKFGVINKLSPDGGSEERITSFTAQELTEGLIMYSQSNHQYKEPVTDGFLFHVTDGVNKSPMQRLNITIILTNDEAPVLVSEQVLVRENQGVTLTNATIYVIDFDTDADDLIISVIDAPKQGSLRRIDFPQKMKITGMLLRPGDDFTYQNVLDELIVYTHEGSEVQGDEFELSVTDGQFNDSKKISVRIGLVNDETPRVEVNHGLIVKAGSNTKVTSFILRASDFDSDDLALTFTITQNPVFGELRLYSGQTRGVVRAEGPVDRFTQRDLEQGNVEYVHRTGEPAGGTFFKFSVQDENNNVKIDQSFMITVIEDLIPPTVLTNKPLTVTEGSSARLSTDHLSVTDVDSEPGQLRFTMYEVPDKGHLELVTSPGVPISEFTQLEVAANMVQYVHTSEEEVYMDRFIFAVSDGSNEITQTFHINISPVDDSIPVVTANGLRVQEGVRKIVSEFDLKAEDLDTKEDQITFQIVRPPFHGTVDLKNGEEYTPVTYFKMSDIYENRISYKHDGSETQTDTFDFLVSDGVHTMCTLESEFGSKVVSGDPMLFNITIDPVDDGTPILEVNMGLHYLEYVNNQPMNVITNRDLKAKDYDTPANLLSFQVTKRPQHGQLERMDRPGVSISSFTQDDLNKGSIRYVLTTSDTTVSSDAFLFNLADTKPNVVKGFTFHITWSVISFEKATFNITEKAGLISIPVKRSGNLKQYAIVRCSTRAGVATSSGVGSRPGQHDFIEYTGQVQFDEWQTQKTCVITINDDSIFEGPETFSVFLSEPAYALLGDIPTADITIYDIEDEPIIQFEEGLYLVNETAGYVRAGMVRLGDITSTVSAMCLTKSLTAKGSAPSTLDSGSDYKTRSRSRHARVVFPPGVTHAECSIQIIDDSVFEPSEQFEIELSEPSMNTRIGPMNQAVVVIEGPNDESGFFFPESTLYFNENSNKVEIPVVRRGSDLSHTSMVWCATRMTKPPSAIPGQDYVPASDQLTFEPGQLVKNCQLTIVDDEGDPRMEGNETLTLFLSSPMGGVLLEPHVASVVINDTDLDIPTMQFEFDKYVVDEDDGALSVPILKTGDLSFETSVICYTRQDTAQVMMDYDERMLTDAFRVTFSPGDKVKMCRVGIVNDHDAELDETFHLKLAQAQGTASCGARVGPLDTTTVTITNPSDVPTIFFARASYSVNEPTATGQSSSVVVQVIRTGDVNQTSKVRCSTRDGSALSGVDYNPSSIVLEFGKGISEIDFEVDILFNEETEWHETFTVQLGPSEPINAVLGEVHTTTVTILDSRVSGSVVLPAQPVVVSLLDYDHVDRGTQNPPSPGYPIVCVTPCDPHYPSYLSTKILCDDAGINQTAIQYAWEVSSPTDEDGVRYPFETVTDNTLFSTTTHMVLESFYFRPGFHVRCVAQPVDNHGNLGIPLRSNIAQIGNNGICQAPIIAGSPYGLQSQSFVAKLKYRGPTDETHPNKVHISIQVPHQDGMLPLISTLPLHNLRFLLSEPIYRQQHLCSNIITVEERSKILDSGFLDDIPLDSHAIQAAYGKAYQFDSNVRETKAIELYKHLNLKSCVWTFDAWFHMSELIDICGGSVVSNFEVRSAGHTYLTVSVPLYVSYIYALAPTGWASMEHHTQMQISFYYETMLWRSGLETEGKLSGKLQVLRISIGDKGRLQIDFKTKTKFRGQYVLTHHSLPNLKSQVLPPENIHVSFNLSLLWSQATYDGPDQLWRAVSTYNLKDYSGDYIIELLPCSVQPTQSYHQSLEPLPCSAHKPQKFVVPIGFQQTNRPVPLEYSLDTFFQLHNHLKMFLSNPTQSNLQELDYQGAYNEGQTIFGRVLWNPTQSLDSAYELRVEKVYICTGKDGHTPRYDPTGELYNEGPQFGCIQPNEHLKHRFLILDRGNPSAATTAYHNIDFNAKLASEDHQYAALKQYPGIDGFSFQVDPLFKVESGHQWCIQVLYIIGPADSLHSFTLKNSRRKRDLTDNAVDSNVTGKWIKNRAVRSGTNIKFIELNDGGDTSQVKSDNIQGSNNNIVVIVTPTVVGFVLLVLAVVSTVLFFKLRRIKSQDAARVNAPVKVRQSSTNLNVTVNNLANYYSEIKKPTTVNNSENVNIYHSTTNLEAKFSVSVAKPKLNNQSKGNGTEV